MFRFINKLFPITLILFFQLIFSSNAEIIRDIEIRGNERVSNETIKMFSSVSINDDIGVSEINEILKNIYESNFFENVTVKIKDNILLIDVTEKPIIVNINYKGIKSKELINEISKDRTLKPRSSYDKITLKSDIEKIKNSLKEMGYYFAIVDPYIENLENKKLNIDFNITLGEKSKIRKISFIGNKIFKDKKLKNIIVSEEYKFWKFISGKKYLNENIILLDERLLTNFYLNKGYKNVIINSSFAKIINDDEFELIFNIDAQEKIFFNKINFELPVDFDKEDFMEVFEYFSDLENEPYSLNKVKKIIEKIEIITLSEKFEAVTVNVDEEINQNKLNLLFSVTDTEKFFVDRINIFGNNITQESVIRNKLLIDEGDLFNDILYSKSINNVKSLNFFKSTTSEIIDGKEEGTKTININVEEKPTGEIALGAGAGTSGATVAFSVKENNFLGKGIGLDTSLSLTEETIRGKFSVNNPNFRNSDKSINFNVQAMEIDRTETFGYKSNKVGTSLGTGFEYYENLNLGIGFDNFYEKISTDGSASALQKTQDGNYWDTFVNLDFKYDTRNFKYDPSDGSLSYYSINLPIISDTNTLTNAYDYKFYTELFENNVTSASLLLKTANSISGDNIKLSERLFIPSRRLRGFESGKIGPKDGTDYIGGNYLTAANVSTTLPTLFSNYEYLDFVLFFDAANIWGVDYSSSINDGNGLRSSVGIGVDWFTPIGPLNFSFAHPITKEDSDIEETFRFNIGTTFWGKCLSLYLRLYFYYF